MPLTAKALRASKAALTLPSGWQPTPAALEGLARLLRTLAKVDVVAAAPVRVKAPKIGGRA